MHHQKTVTTYRKSWVAALTTLLLSGALPGHAADTTLVIGDQARIMRSLMESAGVLHNLPYQIRWANFQGAAPLFEAQRADAVDTSFAGDLPVLQALAGGVRLTILLTDVATGKGNGIVVPADSPIHSISDLKGQQVVVSSAAGSISQNLLYLALAKAGIDRQATRIRFVLPTDASAAFNSGQIKAWAVFDPYLAVAQQNGARLITDASHLTASFSFLSATTASLSDPHKRQAIRDFAERVRQARQWAIDHPALYASSYAQLSHLPLKTAQLITSRGPTASRPVTDADLNSLQQTADRFYGYGILPAKITVRQFADPHFLTQSVSQPATTSP